MESRYPVVAGTFYPADAESLNAELERFTPFVVEKKKAKGIISPHAGYIYSGSVAGELISTVAIPEKIIIIGPNHTGIGPAASIMPDGVWSLPNGDVNVDSGLAEKIIGNAEILTPDRSAHEREHSIEVQLPFLLSQRSDIEIVPITLMGISLDSCRELGNSIARAIKSTDEDVLIVASSDMTHYESAESAERKDRMAIEKILALDPGGLLDVVTENRISMCGVIPATVMLFAAKELGAKRASLVRYTNSGEVSGDYEKVVGYAGMMVE
ncbi:MAG: AmmeMemoRadiSam system protein B [bacterium]|nr:AmmeMemoRadiSam system protein B [bacterium]